MTVKPFPEFKEQETIVDRSKLPEVGPSAEAKFPDIESTELANGMKILLARRSPVPLVRMGTIIDAGYAADQFGTPGTALLAMSMLNEGTKTLYSLEINEKLQLLEAMTKENLLNFYNTWFKPNNATLIVNGDISMDELKTQVTKHFQSWQEGKTPKKNSSKLDYAENKIYLMDRAGATQTIIFAVHVDQPGGQDNIAMEMMNNILVREFTSRVNMNLREEKGRAYGARTLLWNAKGQQPFMTYAPVQTDKTAASMEEMVKELKAYVSTRPATTEEFEKTKRNEVLTWDMEK